MVEEREEREEHKEQNKKYRVKQGGKPQYRAKQEPSKKVWQVKAKPEERIEDEENIQPNE